MTKTLTIFFLATLSVFAQAQKATAPHSTISPITSASNPLSAENLASGASESLYKATNPSYLAETIITNFVQRNILVGEEAARSEASGDFGFVSLSVAHVCVASNAIIMGIPKAAADAAKKNGSTVDEEERRINANPVVAAIRAKHDALCKN